LKPLKQHLKIKLLIKTRMKKVIMLSVVAMFLLLFVQSTKAEVKLPSIVSSNMVLQRNTTVVLWGWADPKEKITIEASWLGDELKVTADKDGNWRIDAETTGSKEPQSIKIKSKSSDITLENVVFGEVWLCSGQSNMQQPVGGYTGQPSFGTTMAVARAENPDLRLFTVDRVGSKTPLEDVKKYTAWQQASPENVLDFSAVAYYFGQHLQEILDVPVGMIHTSWGGSIVEAWISKEVLSEYQEIDIEEADLNRSNHVQTALYNAMISPLIPYTIKGALWYQGESNRLQPGEYTKLFPAMVKDWRTRWDIGDFPFYYVQISPFMYGDNKAFQTAENAAFIREAQLQCLDLIPNSGMAVTMDIGDDYCIHPPKKIEVADRLLFNALNQTYGYKQVDCFSPAYESLEVQDSALVLSFQHAEAGVFAYDDVLHHFEIAGEDRVFYPGNARILNRRNVIVNSENVLNPVAVRYAWRSWVEGGLFDTNLLPASSFRTDDWDDAMQPPLGQE
jgi:sialate O-acetylesterase